MFGIGIMEMVVLAVVILLFVGPRRLPQVMHQCGKMFVRLRRMSSEARDTFDHIIRSAERDVDQEMRRKLTAASMPQAQDSKHKGKPRDADSTGGDNSDSLDKDEEKVDAIKDSNSLNV